MSTARSLLQPKVHFRNVTKEVGIQTPPAMKYGGPTIADLNGDGRYDMILGSHNEVPAPLYWANSDGTYTEHPSPIAQWDVHGIAAGDYDGDGDADVLVSLGGGNGTKPQPPRLKRNDNGQFTDVTEEAGISKMGARGRSVRWIDLDGDGDLDMLQMNAAKVVDETVPRNILFENNGDGTFTYRTSPIFEEISAERVLLTDFNQDHILDLVAFSPLSIWQGNSDFQFANVTEVVLETQHRKLPHVTAAAEVDIDNDGDMDLYLARGKTYYEIANNSLSFNAASGRLDLRDEGNRSHDGITFYATGDIVLQDFFHWKRGTDIILPVYLGKIKKELSTPVKPVNISPIDAGGFPDETTENGWFLGYVGDGEWRLEWNLNDDLAWDVRASVSGVRRVEPDWLPQNRDVPDVLLRNDNGRFIDMSDVLPEECQFNNWGVTHGDFNNDGLADLFVYRFGELQLRIPDVLLLNHNGTRFTACTDHGANVLGVGGHGDMGIAFDYNFDGALDLLSGDDDLGKWYLYENELTPDERSHYLLLEVGYSENGTDPLAAEVTVVSGARIQTRRIGSAGAVHSQSVLSTLHFGLGANAVVDEVHVQWRDGRTEERRDVKADQLLKLGTHRTPNTRP